MIGKSLAIINSKAPYSSNNGKDALDIALIFGSYEQPISLFFHGDGVWQLTDNPQGSLLKIKDYLKTFSAFELYDIEHVYVCEQSLTERGLVNKFHIENVTLLSTEQFALSLAKFDHILRF